MTYSGRVIDPLGEPLDGRGEIEATEKRYIEREAPGVMTREKCPSTFIYGCKSCGFNDSSW